MPFAALRVKMGESSNVRVVVAAGGKFYTAVEGDQDHHRRLRRLTGREKGTPWQTR